MLWSVSIKEERCCDPPGFYVLADKHSSVKLRTCHQ